MFMDEIASFNNSLASQVSNDNVPCARCILEGRKQRMTIHGVLVDGYPLMRGQS